MQLSKVNSLGKSLLLSYTLMSLVLDFSQMVLAVRNHLNRAILIILQNPEQQMIMQFFEKNNPLGMSLFLPYTLVSLVLDFTQMVLAVRKHLEMAIIIILKNPEQPLLMQFFQKFTPWGSPCSCPTPWCL